MSQNLVSITITPEQQATVLQALAQIEAVLKDLITLAPPQRKKMKYMGSKSVDFTRTTIRTASSNPDVLPPNLDIAGAEADVAALDMLLPIMERVSQLSQRIDDTVAALGSDSFATARKAYAQLKLSGLAAGLEGLVKALGGTFARPSRKKK
ncbi:hypothetical protein LF41_2268 [Lysobacter dokdonensis DS-58]|uniref:Uncharacterized protein n=1 Tax=Lysobacter dokdonensis DS-58 TaxID=1300345 RepID=A0A0A2WHV8_9GAMM|nr:hypothetical protein [Lysobacter dokdonensis]KGQ19766.1 hypothetical protein LF41_2268 [Lysobacter dokdonensis DS-58]